ncbi:MAG TPA: hypothetical protein VL961_07765 [Acidimicrobiales bacterium]|nr:hypothetical protein [Acidimicrobiales bacterium]
MTISDALSTQKNAASVPAAVAAQEAYDEELLRLAREAGVDDTPAGAPDGDRDETPGTPLVFHRPD